jgi:hypothetical protein
MAKVEAAFRDSEMGEEQFRKWLGYAAEVTAEATCRDEWLYFVGVLSNSVAERKGETPPAVRGSGQAGAVVEDDSEKYFTSKYAYLYK